jgi:hypothetical protein
MITYQILIQGLLDEQWSIWFEGMQVTPEPSFSVTCLTGKARDQAELLGILNHLHQLNLVVLRFEQS